MLNRLKRLKTERRPGAGGGFTTIEIVIAVTIIAIMIGLAVPMFLGMVERSRYAEALININAIRRAEYAARHGNPAYLNAASTDEINALFALGIQENFYRYQVVDATDSYFRIIATRLGSLSARMAPATITAGPEGIIETLPERPISMDTPQAGGGGGGGDGGGGGGGGGGGSGGSGGASGTGSGGGTTGLLTGGSDLEPTELAFLPRGADVYTDWSDVNALNLQGTAAEIAKLQQMFDLMAASDLSPLADDLTRKGIPIFVGPAAGFTGDAASTIARFTFAPENLDGDNIFTNPPDTPDPIVFIEFNPSFFGETAEVLVSTLMHEATHFGQYLDGTIVNFIAGVVDLIDVEFKAFWNESFYWGQVRESFLPFDTELEESNEAYYQQAVLGEANLKAFIASIYL